MAKIRHNRIMGLAEACKKKNDINECSLILLEN
jgi:hypothetical protein